MLRVAEDRMADAREMAADLVVAARVGLTHDERDTRRTAVHPMHLHQPAAHSSTLYAQSTAEREHVSTTFDPKRLQAYEVSDIHHPIYKMHGPKAVRGSEQHGRRRTDIHRGSPTLR